ncbi:tryptophan--tRNA ligase [Candidatus Gracilibacteria bacterium]|nr:tryptophan--tRNA ligase [Candidatus Gracilibacteria bacterium]
MTRILTGIQSSGNPHWGNYFGMMKPMLKFQEEKKNEMFFFIADLHAFTSVHDPAVFRANQKNIVLDWLALGLDPERSLFYRQSDVPAHSECFWYLMCMTPMGLLERAHSYKDKVAKGLDANVGLFTYPMLMAADILLYDAEVIPVGKDQKQHVEMARDIAQKFNHHFGETFVLPEPGIQKEVETIPGLDGQKMSKSYGNTISIFEDEKSLKKRKLCRFRRRLWNWENRWTRIRVRFSDFMNSLKIQISNRFERITKRGILDSEIQRSNC